METLLRRPHGRCSSPTRPRATSRRLHVTGFAMTPPELARRSGFGGRLEAGHVIALDDPLSARRFTEDEIEYWRDWGLFYFVPCVAKEGTIAVLALGRNEIGRAAEQRRHGAARRGRRAGRHRARERPPLSAAAREGRRARAAARVQRERPPVARRWPRRGGSGRPHPLVEPRDRRAVRRRGGLGDRPPPGRRVRHALRRRA